MKHIYLILLLALILTSCSGPRGDSAGIINGTRISYPEFIRVLQGNTIDFRSVSQRPPDDGEKTKIFNQTWSNIAKRVILNDYYQKYKITSSESEVLDTLSTNIPDYIANSQVFNSNKGFDSELYLQSLRYDSPVDMSSIRKRYFEDYIPIQKLKPHIIEDELLSKKMRSHLADAISAVVDFDLVIFDPQTLDPIVSEAELKAYYQRNIKDYAMDPIYSLSYLSIPIKMQEADLEYTRMVADSIYQEVSYGKSFDQVLEERRPHLPGLKISDSDFVRVENVDPALLMMLEALPDNAQSKLIKQDNGFFIHRKLQRTKSMIRYLSLHIPPVISPATINIQYENALGAMNLAKSMGMQTAATELSCRYHETGAVKPGEKWHQDSLLMNTIESKLATHKKGEYLDPVYSPSTGSWIVAMLTENQVQRAYPFAEVKEQIAQELKSTRQKDMAKQVALDWLKVHPDLKLDKNPTQYKVLQYSQAGIDSRYLEYDLQRVYLNSMLRYLEKKSMEVENLGDLSVILIPRKVHTTNPRNVDSQSIRNHFAHTLQPDWFDDWMNKKLNQANIEIFVSP